MFGYIRPFKPELKIREYETYKAVYCGLCRRLGRSYGALASFTLSYDFTFLAMLSMSLSETEPVFETRRCFVNPLKKIKICADNPSLALGADAAAIMLYYKIEDNVTDSAGIKRACWRLIKAFATPAWKKASKAQPAIDRVIARAMRSQQNAEKEKETQIDCICEPFSSAMSEILQMLSGDEGTAYILGRMGYLLGRYIYICDALDDLEKDAKSGGFNPFLPDCGDICFDRVKEENAPSLRLTIGEIGKACDLLELKSFRPVILNIIHLGLSETARTVTGGANSGPDGKNSEEVTDGRSI
ncbi:MAG: DUF5685 family protein [Oscillospiraceae bacterium]|nr:DUF5685 family protein [Oscillospiraceae bacterium]